MSRNSYGRYSPSRTSKPFVVAQEGKKPHEEWFTPEEHRALQDEFLVMVILVAIGLVCVFCEPLMDVIEAALR